MILTDEKIKVTVEMMEEKNMTRGEQYGIPVDPLNPSKGLIWKYLTDMENDDFDKIEQYFLNKLK